jgi:ferritin-like metal-binding protein YciE
MAMTQSSDKNLTDLLKHGVKDIYYAEKKIYKSLPKMIKAAKDPQLQQGLTQHREETLHQIERLEKVFESLSMRPKAEKCDAIDGILDEGAELLDMFGGSKTGDAAIIFSCQAIEHYEISRYGSMCAYAKALGYDEVAQLFEETLAEEKNADKTLTDVAETSVNLAAEGDDMPQEDPAPARPLRAAAKETSGSSVKKSS